MIHVILLVLVSVHIPCKLYCFSFISLCFYSNSSTTVLHVVSVVTVTTGTMVTTPTMVTTVTTVSTVSTVYFSVYYGIILSLVNICSSSLSF